uniref:Uncharacterized protein n=1 Tax=Lygus hesperus TaxID=30085 RepID=A0A146KXQ3_LYGHE
MACVGQIDVKHHCATWNLVGMGGLKRFDDLRSEIFCIPALGQTSKFHINAAKPTYDPKERCVIGLLSRDEQRNQIVSYQITGSHCEQDTLQAQGTCKISMMPIPEIRNILDYNDHDWEALYVLEYSPPELFIRDDKARVHVKLWRGGCPEPKCYCVQTLPMPKEDLKAICN